MTEDPKDAFAEFLHFVNVDEPPQPYQLELVKMLANLPPDYQVRLSTVRRDNTSKSELARLLAHHGLQVAVAGIDPVVGIGPASQILIIDEASDIHPTFWDERRFFTLIDDPRADEIVWCAPDVSQMLDKANNPDAADIKRRERRNWMELNGNGKPWKAKGRKHRHR